MYNPTFERSARQAEAQQCARGPRNEQPVSVQAQRAGRVARHAVWAPPLACGLPLLSIRVQLERWDNVTAPSAQLLHSLNELLRQQTLSASVKQLVILVLSENQQKHHNRLAGKWMCMCMKLSYWVV